MARQFAIPVPLSVSAGTAVECASLRDLGVQVVGTFVGTIQIQVSINGVDWVNKGSAFTSPGILQFGVESYAFVRANVTAYTSGTPTALLLGHEER